jgi:nicotinate-nucleotide--dimethylbenzimidazole phosphoribosyltransferase
MKTVTKIKTIPPLDERARAKAIARQLVLTKPTGALGRLETLSTDLAAMQATAHPSCERVMVFIFAGDHGVAIHGVSAYPQAVTAQMCLNFCRGGAAVNVLARQVDATVVVVDVGVVETLPPHDGLVRAKVAAGTADFTTVPAMTMDQCGQAMLVGASQIQAAIERDVQVVVLGEMGIANTTSASALFAAYAGLPVATCVGRGTGINDDGLAKKQLIVQAGLLRHQALLGDKRAVLAALGGFEIAAMVGAMIAAAQQRVPVVVDGFIASAAALAAMQIEPAVRGYLIWAHRSAEGPHAALLDYMQASPLLDLGLRLGEGSGGVLAIHLLRAACRTLNDMATFADAGVTDKPTP